ncbi:ABC transporter permease [Lonepinella sp. BR2474]|uniref:ABC transporter permease n=1 Tax=unclassified Lonepinella TaxID=2642006 RepID=UPI003F6DE944
MRALKSLFTLTVKELKSLFSEPALLIAILMVFTVMIGMLANAITYDVKSAPIAIIDHDKSALSYRLQDAIKEPYFTKPVEMTRDEAHHLMDKNKIIFALEIPENFEKDLLMGRHPELYLQVDATMMTQAGAGSTMLTGYITQEISEFLGAKSSNAPAVAVVNSLYNPNAESVRFVPTMKIGDMLALMVMVLVGSAVIRERERGTMEHLLVMPVNASEILLAKILANGLVNWVAAMISMRLVVNWYLDVPINGELWLYGVGLALFLFAISSLGVMLATIAPTMAQFSLLVVPTYMVLLLFSGSAAPRINMPVVAQEISKYWPTTVFADFSQDVLFRGAGIDILWTKLLTVSVVALICLIFALLRFKKMLERQG